MKIFFNTIYSLALSLALGLVRVDAEEPRDQSSTDSIRSFVEQFTNLLNLGAFGQAYQGVQYPENYISEGYQRPYNPRPGRPFPPGKPPPGGPFPLPGRPLPGRPFPPPARPFPPGSLPPPGSPFAPPGPGSPYPPPGPLPPPGSPYPPPGNLYPNGYPGQGGLYPPTSLIGALSSIARYDDLRCVPRLLCEVATGARPGNDYSQQSVVPFISKDALVTLLTVLNFVDDSPLLVFGRAALLGYTARGDTRACLIAYPTCPREPDRLVDYLNNHNGGFFRFFNQQIPQYAPQYQQYQPGGGFPPPRPNPYPPFRKLPQRSENYPQQYSSQNQKYYQSRIQTQPESSLEYAYYTSQSGVPQVQLTLANQDQDYPTDLGQDYYYQTNSNLDNILTYGDYPLHPQYDTNQQTQNQHNYPSTHSQGNPLVFPKSESVTKTRGGKGLSFPTEPTVQHGRPQKGIPMVFPDRTGTGDLRLDVDQYGGYKTVYFQSSRPSQSSIFRDQRGVQHVTFPRDGALNEGKGRPTMHFPKS